MNSASSCKNTVRALLGEGASVMEEGWRLGLGGVGEGDGVGRGREGRCGEEERRPRLRGGEGDKEPRLYFLLKI